ncbi:uncharacterized protein LOC115876616 isoform X2 [Sitophilus oryzae]|uniref:Uncharacterized protein LOC115876616 isoform X2 n=1 Tax=Sitophilus oryzae TaxID=7048 RepID=A0A6J2XBI7_SITOR|nr:uncharacterized protein LOC115876616 isoform X2 [Sitophilus oryzae]
MLPIHVVFLVLLSTFFFVAEAQRKLTRPLPTLAETKGRERANFDCPEEFGYYPHPTDCTQYYVCVFGGALLESCTGGLMYSHELQTCDWPRNVGCDGLELAAAPAPSSQSSSSSGSQTVKSRERSRDKEEIRTESRLKYAPPPPPPPPQPRAVVTSRGQPRQLQNQQEIIKQQLYADVEESLPPAEEVESDRQQRVYRGQPSTVGQVQRDRDGYRHTNSLSSRGEKVEVISFGTQSQLQPYSTASNFNEILTNDLTTEKRQKRHAQRSREFNNELSDWQNGQKKRYIQPPPYPYIDDTRRNPFIGRYQNQDGFQPFIPAESFNNVLIKYPTSPVLHPNNVFVRPASSNPVPNYAHFDNSPFIPPQYKGTVKTQFVPLALETAYTNVAPKAVDLRKTHLRVNPNSKPKNPSTNYSRYQPTTTTSTVSYGVQEESDEIREIEKDIKEQVTSNDTQSILGAESVFDKPKEVYKDDYKSTNDEEQPNEQAEEETDSSNEEKESGGEEKETPKEGESTNTTTTYEYQNHDHDDEDLGPPPSFYSIKNKYEDIYNPFADPEFDFDNFLRKLGSTTTTTTTSTTTTTTTTTPRPKITEIKFLPQQDLKHIFTDQYNNQRQAQAASSVTINYRDLLKLLQPATPNPVKTTNDFANDKIIQSLADKKYSSQIKSGNNTLLAPKVAAPVEYEYYYEEYDYPDPNSSSSNVAKLSNSSKTDVKYSARYQDKPSTVQPFSSVYSVPTSTSKYLDRPSTVKYTDNTAKNVERTTNYKAHTTKYIEPIPKYSDNTSKYLDSAAKPTKSIEPLVKHSNINPQIKYPDVSVKTQYITDKPTILTTSKTKKPLTTTKPNTTTTTRSKSKDKVKSSFVEKSQTTTSTTPKPKRILTTNRKRTTTVLPTVKSGNKQRRTTTELYELDSKPEQSIVISSEDKSSVAPSAQTTTATARSIYNTSQYNHVNHNDNRYDPYYALYDDDVELYKDVDYTPQSNYNSQSSKTTSANVYRGSTSAAREEPSKRGNVAYNSVSQDIYQQPSTVSDYSENAYQDEDNSYRQSSRSSSRFSLRGDRNEINDIEEIPTTKRVTSTPTRKLTTPTTRITTTTQARTIPTKKSIITASSRTPSRGRGTSHYSNSGAILNNEVTVTVNRGTPAPRSRPTLKPSTSIVSKAAEYVDVYRFPPTRPEPIYPQPQPDKTAAKCRKDVCLLPDCYCGGKDIPGDLPVEQVPQIVLLTFDDSVNDLNKGLYQDLFERGRTNPNGCPIAATFYVSHEWTDYSQVQNLYSDGHELASHTVSHSFGEQFSQKKWTREVAGQREILAAYGGIKMEDIKGMRAPFLSVGGNKMFKMLYDSNFTYDSSMPIYENKPPSWPYTLDYKLFHDCMIPPCPTRSYPGVWEVPMVMWQDLNGGRCSMGDACSNPPDAEGVFKMLLKNFQRHYTTNRAPFGLFYHAAWFTQPHHKEGFINFIDTILAMKDVWFLTNWQAIQWVRDPTPSSRLNGFQPFQCNYSDRPKRCNNPKVCNLWHKSGVRYMRTCQPCPDIYPWTGNTGIRSSRVDNDIED